MVRFTYYKKCICGDGTSTTYTPGCPVHDPVMRYSKAEYENIQQRLATAEAVSRNRLETILLLHDCYRDACSEAESILSDLRKLEAERDELQRRCESYKSAYDAILADLRIMEQKLNDLEDERDRLKWNNKRFCDALEKIANAWPFDWGNANLIVETAKAALREVDGGKETY